MYPPVPRIIAPKQGSALPRPTVSMVVPWFRRTPCVLLVESWIPSSGVVPVVPFVNQPSRHTELWTECVGCSHRNARPAARAKDADTRRSPEVNPPGMTSRPPLMLNLLLASTIVHEPGPGWAVRDAPSGAAWSVVNWSSSEYANVGAAVAAGR